MSNPTIITFRLYGYGATATGGTFALGRLPGNDLAIGGTVTPIAGSSISTGAVTTPPFCVDAINSASGNVTFTSTGNYVTETFTAQLSDAAGSFASPVAVGTTVVNGTDPTGSIGITIPAGTPTGAGYRIRIDAIGLALVGSESSAFSVVNGAVNVTGMGSSVAITSVAINWTNPASCYDEVMMVAKPLTTIAGIPTGDGTGYTADLNFLGTGSVFDGTGKVVYKGTTSPQTVTNLTTGTLYFFRIFTRKGTNWSTGVEISATPAEASLPTDYFRSVASGSWSSIATWESSHDSTSWFAATLAPGATASHVVIQNSDSVFLAANTTTINLTIQNSGILNALTFTMTATLRFNLLNTASFYQGGIVNPVPGVEQVLSTTSNYHYNGTQAGISAALPEFGNLIWEPAASGNNTFQNTNAAAPFLNGLVVRGNLTINIQGATPREVRFATGTTISRTHTIDGNLNIISANSVVLVQQGTVASTTTGTVNIGGNLNISSGIFQGTSSSSLNSGDAVVNLAGNIDNTGGTIKPGLGMGTYTFNFTGTGNADLTLGAVDSFHHVTVAASKTVTLLTNKFTMATGKNLTLGGHFILGNFDLDMDGTITGGALASHVVTNGTGLLNKRNIANAANFYYPVGAAAGTFNPVTITNNDAATMDYGARVTNSITPAISVPLKAVNRTWNVRPSATPSSTDILFEYSAGEGNLSFNYGNPLELGQYTPSVWNVIKTGIIPGGSYTANAININTLGAAISSPLVLGNLNAILAFGSVNVDHFTGIKLNNAHQLNWKLTCTSTPRVNISLERSNDGRNFSSINEQSATAARCASPFSYTDAQPVSGTNYYRLKLTDADGKVSYSHIIALLYAVKGFDILAIAPNPVTGSSLNLNVAAAKAGSLDILVTDMQGRVLSRQQRTLIAGFNSLPVDVSKLAKGTYYIRGLNGDGELKMTRFVKQ